MTQLKLGTVEINTLNLIPPSNIPQSLCHLIALRIMGSDS